MCDNPAITYDEIAASTGKSRATVHRMIAELKTKESSSVAAQARMVDGSWPTLRKHLPGNSDRIACIPTSGYWQWRFWFLG
jgi:hypothetical protein